MIPGQAMSILVLSGVSEYDIKIWNVVSSFMGLLC